jgi:putative copper export protein
MGGSIDVAVAAARGVVFAAALQAAGAAMFRAMIGPSPEHVEAFIRRLIVGAALVTIVAVLARSALEPARMAGTLSGVSDPFLWSLLWQSDVAVAQASRLVGAGILLLATISERRGAAVGRWIGIGLIVVSFATMGHTRAHSGSLPLGAFLVVHTGVAAFWFGALWPLLIVLRHADADESTRMLGAFSTVAVRAVPALFAAGIILAVLLIGSVAGLASSYGRLVVLKLVLFALLLGLAAANRYRWVPRLAASGDGAPLRATIAMEIALMLGAIGATAVMTTLYSPD